MHKILVILEKHIFCLISVSAGKLPNKDLMHIPLVLPMRFWRRGDNLTGDWPSYVFNAEKE